VTALAAWRRGGMTAWHVWAGSGDCPVARLSLNDHKTHPELLGSFNSSRPESLDGLRVGLSADSRHYGELLVSAP